MRTKRDSPSSSANLIERVLVEHEIHFGVKERASGVSK